MKKFLPQIILGLLLSFIVTGLVALHYLGMQQYVRLALNDEPNEIATDITAQLAPSSSLANVSLNKNPVDLKDSLSSFTLIYGADKKQIAASSDLNGKAPSIPEGVLDFAKSHGENRITWQPENGLRYAIVVKYFNDKSEGFVVVGKSLKESEKKQSALLLESVATWTVLQVVTLVAFVLIIKLNNKSNK